MTPERGQENSAVSGPVGAPATGDALVGQRIGPYEVVAFLAAGGMGRVYRARDTKLPREVALKVLPPDFVRDPERRGRFEREARVLATLAHPHINKIFGLEEYDGHLALALEFVVGESLQDRVRRGALPVAEALAVAEQIADALEAAHEQGVVHRDLKPANVRITPTGVVQVLDFGLAKVQPAVEGDGTALTTVQEPTALGQVLGTVAYMSPEQARGQAVDRRTDIWALGCVLFELLTGRAAFARGSVSDTLAALLEHEPDWAQLPSTVPNAARALLRSCLAKDRTRRWRDAGDLRLGLETAREALTREGSEGGRVPQRRGRLATGLAVAASLVAVAALAAAGLLWRGRSQAPNVSPVMRFEMLLPAGVELFGAANRPMAISPDGTRVAFVGVAGGGRRVYVRPLEKVEALPIAGSEDAFRCFFSPDGRSIALITATGVLKTISLADGAVATLTDGVTFLEGASWSPDGSILFVRGGALWRIPQSGGTPEVLTTLGGAKDDFLHSWPTASLDGKTVLFTAASAAGTRIEALVPSTGGRRTLVEDAAMPLFVSEGRIVYFRGSELLTATFEAGGLRLIGPERRVLENLPVAYSGTLAADVSRSGAIIYSSGNAVSQLVWVSRQGVETMLNEEFRSYSNPRLSPDGARLVVQAGDLWIQDLSRATFTRLVPGDSLATGYPQWTPDGRRVVFKNRSGLSVVDARGVGAPEAIAGTSISDYPGSVTLDGNTVVINRTTATSSFDVYSVPLRGPSSAALLVSTKAFDSGARLSPDGRWLTYVSNESGAFEVYLRPFDSSTRRWQVSTQGGTQAVWNPNSREIFYRSGNKMMAVEVSTSPDVVLSPPRALFERRYGFGPAATMPNFDVTPDGQRFVMVKNEPLAERLNIVVNWSAHGLDGR